MSDEKGIGMGFESFGGLYIVVNWFCTVIVRKVEMRKLAVGFEKITD